MENRAVRRGRGNCRKKLELGVKKSRGVNLSKTNELRLPTSSVSGSQSDSRGGKGRRIKRNKQSHYFGDNPYFAPLDHSGRCFDDTKMNRMDMKEYLESSEEDLDRKHVHWETGLPLDEEDLYALVESETLSMTKNKWEQGRKVQNKQAGDPSFYTEDGIPKFLKRLNMKVINGERLAGTREMEDLIEMKRKQYLKNLKKTERQIDTTKMTKKGKEEEKGDNSQGVVGKWGYSPTEKELEELRLLILRQRNLYQKTSRLKEEEPEEKEKDLLKDQEGEESVLLSTPSKKINRPLKRLIEPVGESATFWPGCM